MCNNDDNFTWDNQKENNRISSLKSQKSNSVAYYHSKFGFIRLIAYSDTFQRTSKIDINI